MSEDQIETCKKFQCFKLEGDDFYTVTYETSGPNSEERLLKFMRLLYKNFTWNYKELTKEDYIEQEDTK